MIEALLCLAMNVYFEARNQSLAGQLAVAQVTLNRVQSARYPNTVCGVVFQGGDQERYKCHFSWFCDGKSDRPRNAKAWETALLVSSAALSGSRHIDLEGVTHYHSIKVKPYWAEHFQYVTQIEDHIFYAE